MNLEMKDISKSFGSNLVLDGVDFTLEGGEIKALLGENGAGKSTLMNILGGVIDANGGQIFLDGKNVSFSTPKESLEAGIAFIHQELNLINDLAIYENLFIGRELRKPNRLLDHAAMIKATEEVFRRMELDLDPRTMVRDLDASYKQIVEISRAMLMNARLVIMDEPTTSLTDPEIERVFAMMQTLSRQGVGIIFISHKLNEVMTICHSYTVLRDGKMVASGLVKDVTSSKLASFMVGHDVVEGKRAEGHIGKVVMEGCNLSDGRHFNDISFNVHEGEVVGFTGLLGDGRSELFQAVFGAQKFSSGQLFLDEQEVHVKTTSQAVRLGIGYVPRNRKENGIIKDMSIFENGSLATMSTRKKNLVFLDENRLEDEFKAQRKALSIKMDNEGDPITSLSGGNQQKVILARWLSAGPKVLILDNPTQGVDVGAKEEIYEIILSLARNGVAVVVLSSEAQEVMRVASRCYVMYHGRIMDCLSSADMNEKNIMRLATGVEE